MKKPASYYDYGSMVVVDEDVTLAETCSQHHYSTSSAFCSPESSSEDLIISSSSNNHQDNIINLAFLSLSGKNNNKSKDHRSFLETTYHKSSRTRRMWLFFVLITVIILCFVFLVVSFRTAVSWTSHLYWQWKEFHHQTSSQIEHQYTKEEYDYIIVGAGPAGLLVAFHLAKRLLQESLEAYGNTDYAGKVLVLESGTESQSDVMNVLLQAAGEEQKQAAGGGKNIFDIPLLWSELSSKDDWSEYLSHHWPVDQTFLGRAVGGSGIHNAMINVRALPHDFQKWNVTNWSAEEMMPYFDLLEDYQEVASTIPFANYSPPLPKSRGSNGPLKTVVGGGMVGSSSSPIGSYFISSAIAAGFPVATLGFNDAEAVNRIGVGFYEFNIRNGIRDSVAKALLSNSQEDGTFSIPCNLVIQTDATVHKVLFETSSTTTVPRATGVHYFSNQNGGSFQQVRLRRSSHSNLHTRLIQRDAEIILSAGAILSSQILANSGISKGGYLVDSPYVGNNLQDHPVVAMSYRVEGNLSTSILDLFQMEDGSNSYPTFETYLKSFHNSSSSSSSSSSNTRDDLIKNTIVSNSIYGTAGFSVGGFLASPWSNDQVPDIQITVFPHTREPHFMHNNNNSNHDDVSAQQLEDHIHNATAMGGTNILVTVALLQPESRNILELVVLAANNTSNETQSWSSFPGHFPLPQIHGGNLTDTDASRLAWGMNQVRNIMSTPPLKDSIQYEVRPGNEYYTTQEEKDKDLIQYVKDYAMRNAHWSGSTRMGNDNDELDSSVVDSRLRVRGVKSLRIVDAGVMPFIPNGNTHSTTCVIALRAVDLILDQQEELKE